MHHRLGLGRAGAIGAHPERSYGEAADFSERDADRLMEVRALRPDA